MKLGLTSRRWNYKMAQNIWEIWVDLGIFLQIVYYSFYFRLRVMRNLFYFSKMVDFPPLKVKGSIYSRLKFWKKAPLHWIRVHSLGRLNWYVLLINNFNISSQSCFIYFWRKKIVDVTAISLWTLFANRTAFLSSNCFDVTGKMLSISVHQ